MPRVTKPAIVEIGIPTTTGVVLWVLQRLARATRDANVAIFIRSFASHCRLVVV
jgi:hypothetical protein